MVGRILVYAAIDHFLSFSTVTIETVGQAMLPNGCCQNMNLRKMVNRRIIQYPTLHNVHFHKNSLHIFKKQFYKGRISVCHVLPAFSGIKFA